MRLPTRPVALAWLSLLTWSAAPAWFGAPASRAVPVTAWAYQLQNVDLGEVAANSTFDLIVIDYSSDGSESGEWTPGEIAAAQSSGKTLVSYISIGEAEDYRYYWDPSWTTNPPSWLGPENPDWAGNYKVRFWDPGWQAIVFDYLDRIVAQGFDGIYMDIIDAYYYWSEESPEQPNADALMVDFVVAIRSYLTSIGRPDMLVIPQNGEFILVEDDVTPALRAAYLDAIDAIGVEDLFHPGDLDENNPFGPEVDRLDMVREYRDAGKTVLSIDYLTDPALIAQYTSAAFAESFFPYATVRALDVLVDGIPSPNANVPGSTAPVEIQLECFPQPSAGRLFLDFRSTGLGDASIDLLSADGRRLRHRRAYLPSGGMQIDLSPWAEELPSGRYYLRVTQGTAEASIAVVSIR